MRGRKRKPGRRTACGRLANEETEREAMATVLNARARHFGVSITSARDPRLGTALGRLNYQGRISDEQYQAGQTFGELYQRHHRTMGLPTPSPRSVAGLLINEGIFGGSEVIPSPDDVARLRKRFDEAADALDACDRDHRLCEGRRPAALIYRIVCVDEDARDWPDEDIGNLRVALNALGRVFGLIR
ncbi:MAG: hypothetical protein B7Y80_03055 [Hyphomicrobium sp. 32-62-53]|nr:MAG: hypothetical protein B7Y80_03055 [Hyphomicrobium sp. 32-62-53]